MHPKSPVPRLLSALAGLALALACGGSGHPTGTSFDAQVKERVAVYSAIHSDPEALAPMLNGRYREIHERLESLVPDAEKTAADHFVLGNMLYRLEPESSFEHHAKAFAERPSEPSVVLEMAYQHHRRGDCDAAMPLYTRLTTIGWLSAERHALMAHCQLVLGRPMDAVRSWAVADHANRRQAIDAVIHQVFGDLAPVARHDQLMQRVAAKDEAAVAELLGNALEWRQDWWNAQPNLEAFAAGVEAVQAAFGAESEIGKEVALFARSLEVQETEGFAEILREVGLLIDGGKLPHSSYVAKEWMHRMLGEKLATPEELARFLPELSERARSGEDGVALDVVVALLARTERRSEIPEYDRLGWETYGEPRFALSLLASRKTESGQIPHDDPTLEKALRDFPHTPRLHRVALVLATRAGVDTPDDVVRLIDAEYRGLESDRTHGSSYLNSYYGELAKRLQSEAAAASSTSATPPAGTPAT